MRICIYMTKVISLSNEAYTVMKAQKQNGESFSDVVKRLVHETKQAPITDFFGKWPDAERIKKILETDRKRFKLREVHF